MPLSFRGFAGASMLALTTAFAASCSSPTRSILGEEPSGTETLVILGTNDIHGALAPLEMKTRESQESSGTEYQAGGVATLASYIREARSEFGDHFIWLDAGDEFQGTIESNSEQGAPMVRFFNLLNLNGAAVGNHEFDFGPATDGDPKDRLGALRARMTEAHYPYLSANLVEKKTGEIPDLTDLHPGKLIVAGDLKVGVIGLSTLDTPTTTRPENVQDLAFTDLKDATVREARALRNEGAQIIVITAHVGLKCARGRVSAGVVLRKPTDRQGACGESDEMVRFLKRLPPGTVDAVVSGHSHQIVHHWVNGIPVIQGGSSGRYFNLIYLVYDKGSSRVLPEKTRIEGPVPVCPRVFQNQNDCNGDRLPPRSGRGPLVSPIFHGHAMRPDDAVTEMLQPVFARSKEIKNRVVGTAARRVEHERFQESPLGDFVADAVRDAAGAQIALVNAGGIRAPWQEGPITYGEVFQSLPFDNSIVRLRLTGKELKLLLRIAESGSRGFPSISGLQLELISPKSDAPANDLNGDRKIEPWEINRLLAARLDDGTSIRDSQIYTVATIDFLVSGGDDLAWIMSQVPESSRETIPDSLMRDAVVRYLSKMGAINPEDHPLVDPSHRRLVFVSAKSSHVKRRRHRHRKT